jgi:hypothetical protein
MACGALQRRGLCALCIVGSAFAGGEVQWLLSWPRASDVHLPRQLNSALLEKQNWKIICKIKYMHVQLTKKRCLHSRIIHTEALYDHVCAEDIVEKNNLYFQVKRKKIQTFRLDRSGLQRETANGSRVRSQGKHIFTKQLYFVELVLCSKKEGFARENIFYFLLLKISIDDLVLI